MKPTLTAQEHRRVDQVMGAGGVVNGKRRCRCGTLVPHTPNALWEHTLQCEKQQRRADRAAAASREHDAGILALAGER